MSRIVWNGEDPPACGPPPPQEAYNQCNAKGGQSWPCYICWESTVFPGEQGWPVDRNRHVCSATCYAVAWLRYG